VPSTTWSRSRDCKIKKNSLFLYYLDRKSISSSFPISILLNYRFKKKFCLLFPTTKRGTQILFYLFFYFINFVNIIPTKKNFLKPNETQAIG
jgi:hypothetical protein